MVKYALPWQHQSRKRQLIANGTILTLICLGLFYYSSWNVLETSRNTQPTDNTVSIPIDATKCPTLPPQPTCPTCPTPPPAPQCPPPASPFDPQKVAFMVETRPLPHLPALLIHMTSLIPPEWTFRFMGSSKSMTFLRANPSISRLEASKKLTFIDLPTKYSLKDRETISQIFTDPYLYTHHLAPAEHLLVFQPDAIFCANAPKTLNDFLDYDWIGAPWSKTATWGGNGGLSLRRVSKILAVLEHERRVKGDGALEDLWLSQRISNLPGSQMAVANVSKTFSVESVWDDAPLGYHVGWLGVHHEQIWDDQSQVDHVLEYCPEVKMILDMKLSGDKPASVQKAEEAAREKKPDVVSTGQAPALVPTGTP